MTDGKIESGQVGLVLKASRGCEKVSLRGLG